MDYADRVREQREKDRPGSRHPVRPTPDYGGDVDDPDPPVGVCVEQVLLPAVEACPICELFPTCGCDKAWYVRRTNPP